jgi:LuxR family maltose regulon positive regulatory protein
VTDLRPTAPGRLLATKLYRPAHEFAVVRRGRLLDLLDEGARRGITVVCAPAGFGKTTLVADWLHRRGGPVGWVSLDAADSDPVLFWSYVIAACQAVEPGVGLEAGVLLTSGGSSAQRDALLSLVNDLASISRSFTLVLDDYHLIEGTEVHEGMALLAERRPRMLHLVLVSRARPRFPLARLRAQGRVADVVRSSLRFTLAEAAAFLRDVMELEMRPSAVATLEARTEGWVAGLQLAALSMRHRDDREGFVASLSGGNRPIADFLAEEVLEQQRPVVREFLLRTSVLRRMSGPLCDALTGDATGRSLLEELARSNLFVIRLDDEGEWYRFHHLFGEFLLARLTRRGPEAVRSLHDRASRWFEAEGPAEEAVHHALLAEDVHRAADLVERNWRTLDRRHQSGTWRAWAEALPHRIRDARPVLTLGYGWALLDAGEIDAGEEYLDRARELLDGREEERVVADEREFASLPGTLAAARAYVARARGDLEATEHHARRALALLPGDDPFYRGIPAVTVGLGQWSRGMLSEAETSFRDAVGSFRAADNELFTVMATYALGELQRLQGRLNEAEATFRRAEPTRTGRGEHASRLHRGLGEVLLERGDLDGAERHLAESARLRGTEPDHGLCLAMADLHEAKGEPARAEEWLEEAELRYEAELIPESRSVAGRKARWALDRGRLDEVGRWLGRTSIQPTPPADLAAAYDQVTWAGYQVARAESGRAALADVETLLHRLCAWAEEAGRTRDVLHLLLLQARLAAVGGDERTARQLVTRALTAGEPEGFVHVFLGQGPGLAVWIRDAALRHPERTLARRLHAALEARSDAAHPGAVELPVPLTPREVDILRLVAAGLSNKEIARQCFISVATVKRHAANIYTKLDVSNRTRAAARADELGLL